MNYQLIALDVDGTLLTDEHELTEPTKRSVRDVYTQGASIVLCTGRSPVNAFPVMEELGLNGILIGHNGAATVRSEDRSVLHAWTFQSSEITSLIETCRREGIHFDINTIFDVYIESCGEEAEAMYKRFGIEPERVADITKLTEPMAKFTMFGSSEQMDRLEKEWDTIGCPFRPIRSGERFIDIMHSEATKGNALKNLAESEGIPQVRILAIGNYYNDIEMIRYAGMGIAMDNSPLGVKEAADETTGGNNADGVAEALRKHCGIG